MEIFSAVAGDGLSFVSRLHSHERRVPWGYIRTKLGLSPMHNKYI